MRQGRKWARAGGRWLRDREEALTHLILSHRKDRCRRGDKLRRNASLRFCRLPVPA